MWHVSASLSSHVYVCVCVLHAAGVPCDVNLKLPCGAEVPAVSLFLQAASPFFRGALEDVKGSALIPVR
jgi:hypothetical protein